MTTRFCDLPDGRASRAASAAPDWHAAAARVGGVFSEARLKSGVRLVRVSLPGGEFVSTYRRQTARESAIRDVLERAARFRLSEARHASEHREG